MSKIKRGKIKKKCTTIDEHETINLSTFPSEGILTSPLTVPTTNVIPTT